MAIVFGWYSFAKKVFSPQELDLSPEDAQGISFEVRQKCAHLMYIPVFPLGQMYVFRRQGQIYQAPEPIVQKMKSKVQLKTPWYCFALPIALVVILFFSALSGLCRERKYDNYKAEEYGYRKLRIEKALSSLDTNYYIEIRKSELTDAYSSHSVFLKVVGMNAGTVKYVVLETGAYNPLPFKVRDYFLSHKDSLDTLTQSIQNFKRALAKDAGAFESDKEIGVALTGTKDLYKLVDVTYMKGPDVRNCGTGGYDMQSFYLQFLNYGEPAQLVEIKNLEGDLKWTSQLPMKIETSDGDLDRFTLDGEGSLSNRSYKFVLVLKDSAQNTHRFLVEGNEMQRWVSRQ